MWKLTGVRVFSRGEFVSSSFFFFWLSSVSSECFLACLIAFQFLLLAGCQKCFSCDPIIVVNLAEFASWNMD